MKENAEALKAGITALAAAFSAAFGGTGWLCLLFVAAMAADYVTGSAGAMKAGSWSSSAARQGLWHKAGMIAAALGAGLFDLVAAQMAQMLPGAGLPFEYPGLAAPLVLCWYVLTELGSLVENAAALGAPIPPFFARMLSAVKNTLGGESPAKNKKAP